jgi:hypothetical protein
VKIERRGDATAVRLIDIARRRVQVTAGSATAARIEPVRRRIAAALAARDRVDLSRTVIVDGAPTGTTTLVADLPLRVRGTIAVPGRPPVRVSTLLGTGSPCRGR